MIWYGVCVVDIQDGWPHHQWPSASKPPPHLSHAPWCNTIVVHFIDWKDFPIHVTGVWKVDMGEVFIWEAMNQFGFFFQSCKVQTMVQSLVKCGVYTLHWWSWSLWPDSSDRVLKGIHSWSANAFLSGGLRKRMRLNWCNDEVKAAIETSSRFNWDWSNNEVKIYIPFILVLKDSGFIIFGQIVLYDFQCQVTFVQML